MNYLSSHPLLFSFFTYLFRYHGNLLLFMERCLLFVYVNMVFFFT